MQHALGQREGFTVADDLLGEDHELVAAQTSDRVAVAHQVFEALGDGDQQLVADLVPEVVVDRLEAVEVDEQQRDHAGAAMQARERLARAVHQKAAVRQMRERVVQSLVLEVVQSFVLKAIAVGDVLGRCVPELAIAAGAPQQRSARSRPGGGSGW